MDRHHRIDRGSSQYFQPFRGGDAGKWWVIPKYPSGGLQTINTQTFPNVFLHSPNGHEWGFSSRYVEIIRTRLVSRHFSSLTPADALAVWLYKDDDLDGVRDYASLTRRFFDEYKINAVEQGSLFYQDDSSLPTREVGFAGEPLSMSEVAEAFPSPPDSDLEVGSTIASLSFARVGLADSMHMDFGERLSVVTGDNGLGKSFLLDFSWWAATGSWADREAIPMFENRLSDGSVSFSLRGKSGRLASFVAPFNPVTLSWERPARSMTVEALAVFSRADGSFAISDPLARRFGYGTRAAGHLSSYDVWNGRPGVIEGLIKDWTVWRDARDQKAFDRLASVLKRLSPEDMGTLRPGPLVRMPGDNRDIPTVSHTYGDVPVTQTSSGVQRVLLLAYLIIWLWQQHEQAAAASGREPLRRMLVIVDELEAHLHPKWQRVVLPALMSVGALLSSDLSLQMIAATHSPMILASLEGSFDRKTDALYHLYGNGKRVMLEETPFVKYGDVSGWLTSPLFGLKHARSKEAELAIEEAKQLQTSDSPSHDEVDRLSTRLKRLLADDDKFWPRWLYFAEQHGVSI